MANVTSESRSRWVEAVVGGITGVVLIVPMILGFRECSIRGRERFQLQRIYIERCQGTPSTAERVYPYPGADHD